MKVINHHFIGGVYCKEVEIPEERQVITHAHKFDHMSVLTQGCVIVEADGVQNTYYSPQVIEIKAGVKHSVTPVNGPAHWLCIHKMDSDIDPDDIQAVDGSLIENDDLVQPVMQKVGHISVERLLSEVELSSDMWDQHTLRTRMYPDSPHRECHDIWIRYNSWENFDPSHPEAFSNEHKPVWYSAYIALPSVKSVIEQVADLVPYSELGGVLVTKVPPGKQVYPHSDAGRWHSEYYDKKILVLLQSAPKQSFNFPNMSFEGKSGDVFVFDNHVTHSVTNESDIDRISLIMAVKS